MLAQQRIKNMSAVEKLRTKTCDLKGSVFFLQQAMYISSQLSAGLLNRTLAERFLLAETLVGVGSVASMDAGSSNCHTHLRSCETGCAVTYMH